MAKTILQQKFRWIQNCPIPRSWDLRIARADTTKLGWMPECIRGISDFAHVLPTFYAHNEEAPVLHGSLTHPNTSPPFTLTDLFLSQSLPSKHTHFLSSLTVTSRVSFLFPAPCQHCQLLVQGTKRQHCCSQCSKLNPQCTTKPQHWQKHSSPPSPRGLWKRLNEVSK